eukprot:CAMPEP_0168511174 /NCGR_PEP_ID=MMETSP0405-20121227/1957_1 /TAXON_ID=498012 /ORGANISM="Trichosphaerium sp, Strain Am-I-7 wt" /LENGTH=89 /DNA_ID=CAMNT_0008529259 /DNA_START=624 /DNA_END=890 /DNA_ORIENTATION=+
MDSAYASYVGMLLLDHSLNNPIVIVAGDIFTKKLHELQQKEEDNYQRRTDEVYTQKPKKRNTPEQSKRALARWHLFSLLARNPSLIKYR